jgi:uncharacterized membrane protein YbhN (UPF0104 family)
VLRRVLRWIGRARQSRVNGQFTSRVTWRVLLPGWVAVALGWVLLGLSFWATLRAIDLPSTRDIPLRELPHLTATLALAVVAGFVALLPAGVGVREMILNEMMVRQFGEVAAIVAPLTLRIVWLVSELCISSILYFAFPRSTAGRESKECAPEPTTRTDVD